MRQSVVVVVFMGMGMGSVCSFSCASDDMLRVNSLAHRAFAATVRHKSGFLSSSLDVCCNVTLS